jgi:pimeloyl-ACP methyl ester carboxylesterase
MGDSKDFGLRFVELHGHQMAYRRAGRGSAVLLIHGMVGSSRTWREAMPRLAEDHDVIAPDLMGHGASAKPRGDYALGTFAASLRDLLAVLDVDRVTLVGQSLGGGVAMQFVYQYPDLVERLVLVGSGGLGREVNPVLRALTLPGASLLMPLLFPGFVVSGGEAVSRQLMRVGVRSPQADEIWRAYTSLTGAADRQAFIQTLRSVVDHGGQKVTGHDRLYLAADMPTLLVWGDADPVIPVEHGRRAHEAIAGSRLEVFEGVGHFPHAEAPERFCEVLLDFITHSEPSRSGVADYRMRMEAREAS